MMRTTAIRIRIALRARPTLRRVFSWRWPLRLLECVVASRTLIRGTRWAPRNDDEARFVRALALLPALALKLRATLGDRASEPIRELATAFLEDEDRRVFGGSDLLAIPDPRARWHAFFDHAVNHGIRAFDETECVSLETDRFHLRVYRCVFSDLAREVGMPELAHMACIVGMPACSRLLPTFRFHRNGSAQATLAHGARHCDYIWERPEPAGDTVPQVSAQSPVAESAPALPAPAAPVCGAHGDSEATGDA